MVEGCYALKCLILLVNAVNTAGLNDSEWSPCCLQQRWAFWPTENTVCFHQHAADQLVLLTSCQARNLTDCAFPSEHLLHKGALGDHLSMCNQLGCRWESGQCPLDAYGDGSKCISHGLMSRICLQHSKSGYIESRLQSGSEGWNLFNVMNSWARQMPPSSRLHCCVQSFPACWNVQLPWWSLVIRARS